MGAAGNARRRLVVAAASPLWPVRNGLSLRMERLLHELSRCWDIWLIAPPGPKDGAGPPTELEQFIPFEATTGPDGAPLDADRRRLAGEFEQALEQASPAAALLWSGAEFLGLQRRRVPVVIDRIDCLALIAWRYARTARGIADTVRGLKDGLVYARFERRLVRAVPATVVVGEADAAALRVISGRKSVHVVPNGVDVQPDPDPGSESPTPTIVFSGTLSYPPNVDAAAYFVTEVWDEVCRRVPGARFVIAGRDPAPEVLALARRPGVGVQADVPDMFAVLRNAWVAVAPMRNGAGIKNKVLEAWAAGKPVVLTELAASGLRMDSHAAGLIATRPRRMAELLVRLLQDAGARHELGRRAHALAMREHGWTGAAWKLSALLEQVAAEADRP